MLVLFLTFDKEKKTIRGTGTDAVGEPNGSLGDGTWVKGRVQIKHQHLRRP